MATNKNNTILGTDLMVYVKKADGSFNPIAYSTNASITFGTSTSEVSSKDFGAGWSSPTITQRNWSMTTDAMYSVTPLVSTEETFDTLMDCYMNGTEVTVCWAATQNSTATNRTPDIDDTTEKNWIPTGTKYEGQAIITDLNATAGLTDAATFSVTFTGQGGVTKK